MESLRENKALLYSLLVSAAVVFVLALGVLPDLSASLQIVNFTDEVMLCQRHGTGQVIIFSISVFSLNKSCLLSYWETWWVHLQWTGCCRVSLAQVV